MTDAELLDLCGKIWEDNKIRIEYMHLTDEDRRAINALMFNGISAVTFYVQTREKSSTLEKFINLVMTKEEKETLVKKVKQAVGKESPEENVLEYIKENTAVQNVVRDAILFYITMERGLKVHRV